MPYLEFIAPDGTEILVEVSEGERRPAPGSASGTVRAGFGDRLQEAAGEVVTRATTSLQDTLHGVVRGNAQALMRSVSEMPDPPDEVEVSFAVRITAEGNAAVCKAAAEGNYAVTLSWKSLRGAARDGK